MLEKLSKEQEMLLTKYRDKWINKLFLNREVAPREEIIKHVNWLYGFSGLKKPMTIVVDSPLAAQYAANMFSGDQVGGKMMIRVRDHVRDQVEGKMRNQVWDKVMGQVEGKVVNQVGKQVWDKVMGQVEGKVGGKVREQVGDQVRGQVEGQLREYKFSIYGNISDYGWVSFYDYFQGIGVIDNNDFNKFKAFIESGIYEMIQLDGLCIVSTLPKNVYSIWSNNTYQCHCEDGAAIEWEDGYKVYYLYGVRFGEDLYWKIVRKELTFKEIMQIENLEQRYAAIRMADPDNLINESKADLISVGNKKSGYNKDINRLYKLKIDDVDTTFLRFSCPSTGRVYMEFVENSLSDADEAQAWCLHMSKDEYMALSVET